MVWEPAATRGERFTQTLAALAAWELRWAVLSVALVGLWTVPSQRAAGRDPRHLSLAAALRQLRAVRCAPPRRCRRRDTLAVRRAGAVRNG